MFGKPLDKWSITELAKNRAVMRQNSHMAFPFSVQEVIRMGRHPYRTRNTGDETEHIMALCDCQTLAARDYRHLSGGEQQRVQLARLLVQLWEPEPEPKWLFLDEPTSALDPEMIGEVLQVMKNLAHSGITMIVVTHEMHFAREIADRVVFIDGGEILEVAAPEDFFTRPQHPRTQRFLKKVLDPLHQESSL